MNDWVLSPSLHDVSVSVEHQPSLLKFQVCARIVHVLGEDVEPQRQKGEEGSFVYYGERPSETFVIYILNKGMFDFLANMYNKQSSGLHIHKCVNTLGDMICWPEKIDSKEAAIEVLKKWSGIIGALLVSSEVGDINGFYEKYEDEDGDWGENAIRDSGVQVQVNT